MEIKTKFTHLTKKNIFGLFTILFLLGTVYITANILIKPKELKIGLGAIPGDVNSDGVVDIIDFQLLSNSFGKTSGQSGYNVNADFNHDNVVDILDFQVLSNNFGHTGTTLTPTSRITATPTLRVTTGPTPTLPAGSPYRAFSSDSYWNTPMPVNAPIDPHSSEYITDSQTHYENYLGFSGIPGNTAYGWRSYWPTSNDPLYTLSTSPLVQVHIPIGAQPTSGTDGEFNIYDLSTNQNVALWKAVYNSSSNTWSYGGLSRYMLSSNGIDKAAALSNDTKNFGHRGIPGAERGIRVDEVRTGAINHRLECYWWATGTGDADHYWPMTGSEGTKGGIVPEGIVIRIKPTVNLSSKGLSAPALVIAKAMQQYGCLVGDNSGGGNRVKLEIDDTAWRNLGLTSTALSPIPWSDWEFIRGGYNPVTGTIVQ